MFVLSGRDSRLNGNGLFWVYQCRKLRQMNGKSEREFRIMDKKRFYRRWKRQYLRGLSSVREQLNDCCKTGSADAVHELRVAIRRTRLLASIGRAAIGRKRTLAFRAWSQRVADALSPVRDYDVMIEWATEACQDAQFVRELQEDRKEAWRDARKALREYPGKWAELRKVDADRGKRRKLAARFRQVAGATREVIDVDAASFEQLDSTARHDFRRAVRRMKYLAELNKTSDRRKALGTLQGGLGELQNAQAVKELLRKGRNHVGRRRQLIRRVNRQESQWFTRCRKSVRSVMTLAELKAAKN